MIKVNSVYATIQGEGALTGTPMSLIRLQGCGVGCPWCDTKETWTCDRDQQASTLANAQAVPGRWIDMSENDVAYHARRIAQNVRWALLTGGEPSEQDLSTLVRALHDRCFKVALETSGTADGHMQANVDWICVSPKFDMPGGKTVRDDVAQDAHEIKMVIAKQADVDHFIGWLNHVEPKHSCVITLQPVSQNERATELCINACLSFGWRLSIQTHKFIGLA